jgi:hypothetical protein
MEEAPGAIPGESMRDFLYHLLPAHRGDSMEKLSVKAFALACGITFAIYVVFIGWTAAIGWGTGIVNGLSSLYIGYAPSFLGGIIGGVYAFVDGAIGGAIFALLYNALVRKR